MRLHTPEASSYIYLRVRAYMRLMQDLLPLDYSDGRPNLVSRTIWHLLCTKKP